MTRGVKVRDNTTLVLGGVLVNTYFAVRAAGTNSVEATGIVHEKEEKPRQIILDHANHNCSEALSEANGSSHRGITDQSRPELGVVPVTDTG